VGRVGSCKNVRSFAERARVGLVRYRRKERSVRTREEALDRHKPVRGNTKNTRTLKETYLSR